MRIDSPIRLQIEEDPTVIEEVAKYLMASAWNDTTRVFPQTELSKSRLESFAKRIYERLRDTKPMFRNKKYHIFLRGKRKLHLLFKGEPDRYIGSEYGLNFLDACRTHLWYNNPIRYNIKKNTLNGRILYQGPYPGAYEAGIKECPENKKAVWFKLSGHIFTLEGSENIRKAEGTLTELKRVLDDYLYANS